ncbi:multifunctional CCA addition/repair protein [Orbaceae bacterium ac157xtp]
MEIYLVGGAVRDKLLNLPIKDKDWVVVGATPQILLNKGFQQVGKDFPVFLHPQTKQEYALARTERKSGKGYKGFICDFNPNITLEEDLARRDLTINAIAMNSKGDVIDPFNGLSDLKNRILRHVSPAFAEDPLRVLRVARFAARFYKLGFSIAPETMKLMQLIVKNGEMQALTAERVWNETEKALATSSPEIYFLTLKECGALQILFPEIENLFAIQHHSQYRNLGNLTLTLLSNICEESCDLPIRFATVTAYLSNDHTSSQQSNIDALCDRFRIPNLFRKLATLTNFFLTQIKQIDTLTPEQSLFIFKQIDVWRHPERLEQLTMIALIDAKLDIQHHKTIKKIINTLITHYKIAKEVSLQAIIEQGYKGKEIQEVLFDRRKSAINSLKNS